MKYLKILFRLTSAIPIMFLFVFFVFTMWSWYHIGHFPTYNNPDPKTIPYYNLHETISNIIFNMVWYSPFIWIPAFIVLYKKKAYYLTDVFTYWIGIILIVVLFLSKWYGWYAD